MPAKPVKPTRRGTPAGARSSRKPAGQPARPSKPGGPKEPGDPSDLKAEGPTGAAGLLEPGSPAPAFDLPDQQGRRHRLSDYRGQRVVLYFYPKDDTPGCTTEACNFRDHHGELVRAGAVVLGVSPDGSASHARFADKYQLPFALLADEGAAVGAAYGVWQQKSMYGRTYMGVARTTYLIGPTGRVLRRWDKVKVADHHEQVLEALRSG